MNTPSNRYFAAIRIPDSHYQMMKMGDLQLHIKQKLAYEFLSVIEQKMEIKSEKNNSDCTVRHQAGLVILTLDEYDKLRYNSVSSEDRFAPHTPKREPEFDAVNYLKNLMKKSR